MNATRTWARYSSRFSPRIPVETMSTARMFRSDVFACSSACLAASSVDVLELPTSSMILTTATISSFGLPPLAPVFYPEPGLHARSPSWRAAMPSSSAARCHRLAAGPPPARGGGAVSIKNCSTAATTAAASPAEAAGDTSSIRGRGGRRLPFALTAWTLRALDSPAMSEVPVLDAAAVHTAVPPERAIERTRLAFEHHARGEWAMPPKVYVDSPPHGDFRAMPARGDGFASLKWVTSFPHNPERGLPVVAGALLLSDAGTGALLAIVDCAAVTSLRTGAAAAVAARTLAR